jgi:hypothetical protein
MKRREISSRFLTIGLSSSHDAAYLNVIANSGSKLGHFEYIDTSLPDYKEKIKELLMKSLSIAREEIIKRTVEDV